MPLRTQRVMLFTIALVLFGIDRVVKYQVMISGASKTIFSWLRIEYHLNTDMALSLPLIPWVYIPLLALVTGLLAWLTWQAWQQQAVVSLFALAMIWAGAISNGYDRIAYSGVIDYINVTFWSVFNLADSYIVIGVAVIMIGEFMQSRNMKVTA